MITLSAQTLLAVAQNICRAAGCDQEEVEAVAGHLAEANLKGHDSHGIGMLEEYVAALHEGRIQSGRRVRIVQQNGPVLVLDAQLGLGQVVARQAMDLGVAAARQHGVALVALRQAHHIGRIGAWAEQCADAGCISIHFVNVVGHPPYVAPFGGRDARAGTDPFCAGLPATEHPIILDMATSKLAFGKIKVAYNKGITVPEGALVDAAGRITTNPAVMFEEPRGVLLPFGDHKGYGLMVLCELLGGALTGGGVSHAEMPLPNTIINNMLSIIIDPAALDGAPTLRRDVDAFSVWVKSARPQEGVAEILLPGEPERRSKAERLRSGIPIDDNTWAGVQRAAVRVACDLAPLLARDAQA